MRSERDEANPQVFWVSERLLAFRLIGAGATIFLMANSGEEEETHQQAQSD